MNIHHNGTIIDVPVTAKAVHKATLMKEDYIKLSFNADEDYKFNAGDWVEVGGMRYYLHDDYFPTMKDEATFAYELQFNAPWYNLDNTMFLFNTYHDDVIVKRESDWYITDTARNILALIIRSTQDELRDCQCRFNSLLDCEPTEAKTFTFSSTSILAALNSVAKEFELEWWVTYEDGEFFLHLGECDNSIIRDSNGAVTFNNGVRAKDSTLRTELSAGVNVTKPSVSQKQGLKQFYYVFGSSRNIDQSATEDMEAGFITSIVTKRLELAGNPQNMHEGSGEEVVIFEDIYPRSDYMITGVTPIEIVSDEVLTYDNDGNPIYRRYNVYNLKIQRFSEWIFYNIEHDDNVQNVEDMVASGKPLSCKFITKDVDGETRTPKLAGFEFELGATLVTDPNTGERWYEFQIIKQDVNGYIIPNDTLIPEVGDWVCIFNVKGAYADSSSFDGVDPTQYNPQLELQNAFLKWYANKKRDVSYTVKPYANESIDLNIGDAVVLNYKENSVVSRVYSYEKHLDYNIDASYTISSYAKFGSVNQLKEDVKILTASIANGTAGGSVDASTVNNLINVYGRRMFLSKVSDDEAAGHITFADGLTSRQDSHLQRTTFGTFSSGFLGSGACIDADGNAVVKSLYSREFISTPEFRFNRISVTEGEQWNTNGFGIIDEVVGNRIYLRLEKGDIPSIAFGDFCRGLYNNIGLAEENGDDSGNGYYNLGDQPAYDACNFPTKVGFFTSYFKVTSTPRKEAGEDGRWYFTFVKRTQDTPDPCKNMKFAQYGNATNPDRQSSLYQTSIRHSYIQQLEGVDDWVIRPINIVSRYGYLGDLTVTLKNNDGSTYDQQLSGNGLYVQKNVYFGGATIQLDPVTIEDLKNQLANYEVYLSAYTDIIKVDDAGNVIEGLWTDTGEAPDISRQYRIYTDVTVRNGTTPLIIEESNVPIGKGYYKIHVQPYGCSCIVENSTIYVTGIDNVKDGVAGTEDDVNFDYDACRAMERCHIDIEVDCEGVGVIRKTMPITIKHDPVPYIMADLTNENAGVSWDVENGEFIGLPIETYINMAKGNEYLNIISLMINTINGVVPVWSSPRWSLEDNGYVFEVTDALNPLYGWKIVTNHVIGNEDYPLAGLVKVVSMPSSAPAVSEILITCHTYYAGVNYERTLALHIMRNADLAIWDIIPTHQSVTVDKNAYFNFPYVGVRLYCTDINGRNEVDELPDDYHLDYRIKKVVPKYTPVSNPSGNPSEQGWFEFNSEGPSNLPYDAEISFLESNGTQFIETGIIPNGTTGIKVKILQSGTADTYYAGLRNDSGNTRWCLGTSSRQYAGYGGVVSASQTMISGATENSLNYLNDRKFICTNGTDTNTGNLSTLSFTPAYNIRLFGSAGTTGNYTKWSGKIYWAKISQGSNVVMDLIPVRIGQVGYLYDKISGQLYGNKGTGVFILGADVSVNETNDEGFAPTHDTTVQSGKTYYVAGAPYSTTIGEYINIPDISEEIRVNHPSYAGAIKSIEFTLFNNTDGVEDSEEVPIIREGLGGQGSTGPAGNGVQGVTTYYLRTKVGYTPIGNETVVPDSAQADGIWSTTFVAPNQTWPCVWMFTKYDYTQAATYRTPATLLTTWSEDGNGISAVDIYYLKTTIDNIYNLTRLDQAGNTLEWVNAFSTPDSDHPYVWRYMKFTYTKASPFYSSFELVAKFVEDGLSNQCAYKVFDDGVTPELDSVSTGANAPTTNSSSWSFSTTNLVVEEGQALWMTQRTHKGTTTYNNWGDPVRISGDKGETGADGKNIEFIYKQTNDPNPTAADRPTLNENVDGFLPPNGTNPTNTDLGWTNNPQGVSKDYKYEWMCQRIKPAGTNQPWGSWVGPFVWSAYGDTGMDGDGLEYVFKRQDTKPSTPSSPVLCSSNGVNERRQFWYGSVEKVGGVWKPKDWTPTSGYSFTHWEGGAYNTQGEWIPEYWSDDPKGVSENSNETIEWVSTRRRVNGTWGDFCSAAQWANFSKAPDVYIDPETHHWIVNGDDTGICAEGQDGTGVKIKGKVDYFAAADIPNGVTASSLEQLTADINIPKAVSDCYLVTANNYLYVYNGSTSSNWADKWTNLGAFKGPKGDSVYMHIAWATGMIIQQNGTYEHPIVSINGVVQSNYFDLVQQVGVNYEWMGICTTDSESNPNHTDPSQNSDWSKYAWNHIKGKDGADYERIYMTTSKVDNNGEPIKPTVNTSYPTDFQEPDCRPYVLNQNACGAAYYQFYDDPVDISEDYPYEWVLERKKVDGVWQPFGVASLWAKYGKDGEQGDSITSVVTKYLKTTMATGVTYTTEPNNWTTTYEAPDEDKPYVWRYTETTIGDGTPFPSSACERIAVYSPVPNLNLLEDTAFSSEAAMEAWIYKGKVSGDPNADPNSQYYNSDDEQYDNIFGIATGTQGHNAYYGRFRGSNASGSYVVLLQQYIFKDEIVKIEPNKWYTLSYWVKGNAASMFDVALRAPSVQNVAQEFVDTAAGVYVNGQLRNARSIQFKYSNNDYSTSWTKHTITFKTVANLPQSCYVLWTMYNRTVTHEIYVCMPKLEVGMLATTYSDGSTSTKAWPRTGEWEVGKQYYAGNIGERYIDAVYKGPNWYRCYRTHISDSSNSPTGVNGELYWKQASWAEFTATGLLLAQEAFVENLGVGILRTGQIDRPHVEMFDAVARFFGNNGLLSIELATDNDGVGVLRFYDKFGNAMYDLGPTGILQNFSQVATSYSGGFLKPVNANTYLHQLFTIQNGKATGIDPTNVTTYYSLREGYKSIKGENATLVVKYLIAEIIDSTNCSTPSAWNGKTVKANNYTDSQLAGESVSGNSKLIPDGWYCETAFSEVMVIETQDEYPLYCVLRLYKYEGGVKTQTKRVYFNDTSVAGSQGYYWSVDGTTYNNNNKLGVIMS